MMREVLHELGLYRRLLAIHVRSQLQYRASFIFEAISTGFTNLVGFISVLLVLNRFEGIGGWSIGEVAFLYGTVEIAFGLMDMVFSGFDPDTFSLQVQRGTFDQVLLRPVDISLQVLGSQFVLRRVGRIVEGFLFFAFALTLVEIHWTPAKLFYWPLVVLGMMGFFGGLFIIGSTITFWTIERIEAVNIFTYGGTELISYPMSIYPDWLRGFFTYFLPAFFLNYYPALYFLDRPDPFHFPYWMHFIAPLVGLGLLALALAFWNYGIRHYQSTGT